MTEFTLPDLGEGLQEAEIVTWHVTPGDNIIADQPLVSVETDKAVLEIPAPVSGLLLRRFAEEGDMVAVGAPLAEIDTESATDAGAIVGDLPDGTSGKPSAERALQDRPRAVPAVRRLARESGVDLSTLTGSGPGGAILSRDVEAAAARGTPIRGVRRAMAGAMARSRDAIVPATVTDQAVISAWTETEEPTPRLVRAIVAGCRAEPALNAWFEDDRLTRHAAIDLAIAVDTPDGLFSLVLRDVGRCTDVKARLAALRQRAMTRALTPDELRGGTITLSNFGTLGGRFAVLVVSPPQVAILGAGRISEECVAENGQAVVRPVLPLSLTFDHRVVTGAEAARFLGAVRASLEHPSLEEEQP
ncbi:dihydrolipoamide acetyltransferase family protein [Aliiruegeria lutimaris]|uniref:Dihydrolipoamide acetyltransferase component of pyruvate dehydrogenase complex n=1 Tax=Aliiruegeria lutimaris TaxID=571298 RepID=A0A1G8YJZ3_9RHOB|nr:dihydrolipoamide acetyltransferase family protein [Aliiruegeria lutimaris]SDK03189.1 pyruvate dehydrogenase E2 component (dihydrolipoamide acetyltransferase) [Aliiruegeria lutimaris]